jgi:hypothetical protein
VTGYCLESSTVCNRLLCWYRLCIKHTKCTVLKTLFKIWLQHFLHNKYDLYKLKLLLRLVVETCSLWHYMFWSLVRTLDIDVAISSKMLAATRVSFIASLRTEALPLRKAASAWQFRKYWHAQRHNESDTMHTPLCTASYPTRLESLSAPLRDPQIPHRNTRCFISASHHNSSDYIFFRNSVVVSLADTCCRYNWMKVIKHAKVSSLESLYIIVFG